MSRQVTSLFGAKVLHQLDEDTTKTPFVRLLYDSYEVTYIKCLKTASFDPWQPSTMVSQRLVWTVNTDRLVRRNREYYHDRASTIRDVREEG